MGAPAAKAEDESHGISAARDSLDGNGHDDEGVTMNGVVNIVPADSNSLAFGRSPGQVQNTVYLTRTWPTAAASTRTASTANCTPAPKPAQVPGIV
jgi:hypothetical protein